MDYLPDALWIIAVVWLISKLKDWIDRGVKRTRTENQLHGFIRAWFDGDISNNAQLFKANKQMLMSDWLDAHPRCTRIDFCLLFDQIIDGHCESFAIDAYLTRRALAFPRG